MRALARDLTRLRTWTLSLFAKDVRYQVTCWLETSSQEVLPVLAWLQQWPPINEPVCQGYALAGNQDACVLL